MCAMRSVIWAGQAALFGQRRSTSPSFSSTRAVPHDGHAAGMENSLSEPLRASSTGATISGITSPALRRTTRSPMRTPLRLTSWALCRVARATLDPATRTDSMTP